ncbi:MAG: helix-turn-helix domain-containing protein [Lachnospiraceae bacterium]|nr:helix-turn-helix domain-containing protein [Lachnospiraceae bacterium]
MDFLQEFNSEDLYMRYAVDEAPDDRNFVMHVHDRCEIYYFVSGKAEYLVEGANYQLIPGSILIMRPSESHRVKILGSEKYERYAINFSVSIIDNIDPQRRLVQAFFDRPSGRGNLYLPAEFEEKDMRKIFAEMCDGVDDYEKKLNILTRLFQLLNMIDKAFLNRGSSEYLPPQSISEKMVSYVNTLLFDDLSVPILANHFFLSASQFSRIFKQATGAAPWEYITIKRLNAAREKIRSGCSAQNASEICGFGDYSAFYRAYVKYFGYPPQRDLT